MASSKSQNLLNEPASNLNIGEYLHELEKDFDYIYMGPDYSGSAPDAIFKDVLEFISEVFGNGIKAGHYFFKIGDDVHHIFFPENIE